MATPEPKFEVIERFEGFEVRRLSAHWRVSIEIEGAEQEAGNRAFRPLLAYISGENEASEKIAMTAPVEQSAATSAAGEKIAMTAPVTQEPVAPGRHRVSFILPEEFNRRPPPRPRDSRLTLSHSPERWIAALRYSGTWSIERYHRNRDRLLEAVASSPRWRAAGSPVWARFDAPFMPWFLRRNEVQLEVKPAPRD